MNLRKLAQARPTMPCIPLVVKLQTQPAKLITHTTLAHDTSALVHFEVEVDRVRD